MVLFKPLFIVLGHELCDDGSGRRSWRLGNRRSYGLHLCLAVKFCFVLARRQQWQVGREQGVADVREDGDQQLVGVRKEYYWTTVHRTGCCPSSR